MADAVSAMHCFRRDVSIGGDHAAKAVTVSAGCAQPWLKVVDHWFSLCFLSNPEGVVIKAVPGN